MAQANTQFKVPNYDGRPDREFNSAPPIIPPCEFLIEKESGMIHVYSEALARRSDFVEPYDGPFYEVEETSADAPTKAPVKSTRKAKTQPAHDPSALVSSVDDLLSDMD